MRKPKLILVERYADGTRKVFVNGRLQQPGDKNETKQ